MRNLKKVLSLVLAMAMMLSVMVVGAGATSLADYSDNDKVSAEYAVAVDVATQLGILEGVGANKYNPQGNLTRAQLATMTYRITTADVTDVYTANFAGGAAENFTDTPADAWYAGYVGYAADAGYLKGVGDDLYKPNSYLTGYQALAAFLRAIGYNEPGQFTGADWTVQVAKVANQIGALEGIKGVDLNAAISREVAAQIIYNILFSNMVEYTPAFGYQDLAGLYGTLAKNEFGIDTAKEGKAENIAPWGRVATVWEDDSENVVTIMAKPVATFKTAATECEISTAIGETGTWDAYTWLDGKLTKNATTEFDAKDTKTVVPGTAQGTLTEVYAVDKHYEIVEIQTWLGQVTDFTAATYDKAGHEKTPNKTDVEIFGGNNAVDLDTAEFAKGDYVLANYSNWVDEDGKAIGFFLTATAPVDTAKVTEIDRADSQTTIGGTTYDWAKFYVEGNPAIAGKTYNVFEDFYGNLIGLVKPAEADPVYTILESGIYDTDGYDSYVAGKVVDLASGDLKDIAICSYDQFNNWGDKTPTYVHAIVKYVECEDGYEMTYAADAAADTYSIVKGTPRINVGGNTYVSDANTIYAVETECGEYDIYTGYASVPTVNGTGNGAIEVLDSDDDGYVDLVYVDAANALFAGEEIFAYIMPGCEDIGGGELADGTDYDIVNNVVIGGEVVKVLVQDGKQSAVTSLGGKAVTLKTDADGLVYVAAEVNGFNPYTVAKDSSGEVIYVTDGNDQKSYVVTDDSIVWVVNEIDKWAEIGTAADVTKDTFVSVKLADNERDVDTIIIWNKDAE